MKKNNKGFTLVELLAVIVVLAIIMVIATQQINKTINRSRAKSFNETFNIIVENARILFAEAGNDFVCTNESDGNVNTTVAREGTHLHASLDYNSNDYLVGCQKNSDGVVIVLSAVGKDNGKFKNVDTALITSDLRNEVFSYDLDNKKTICTVMKSDGTFEKCKVNNFFTSAN